MDIEKKLYEKFNQIKNNNNKKEFIDMLKKIASNLEYKLDDNSQIILISSHESYLFKDHLFKIIYEEETNMQTILIYDENQNEIYNDTYADDDEYILELLEEFKLKLSQLN